MFNLGAIMKGAKFTRDRTIGFFGSHPALIERRKSYYPGKYNREVFLIVVLLACATMFMLRWGI